MCFVFPMEYMYIITYSNHPGAFGTLETLAVPAQRVWLIQTNFKPKIIIFYQKTLAHNTENICTRGNLESLKPIW